MVDPFKERGKADDGIVTGTTPNLRRHAEISTRKLLGLDKEEKGCFPAGTMISTALGDLPIETFGPGDKVLSWCPRKSILVQAEVIKRVNHSKARIWEVTLGDMSVLRTTAHHAIKAENGWQKISSLRTGMKVQVLRVGQPSLQEIVSVAPTAQQEPVFNLITAHHHNFVAGGVLAHNFTHFRELRVAAWRLYALAKLRTRIARNFKAGKLNPI